MKGIQSLDKQVKFILEAIWSSASTFQLMWVYWLTFLHTKKKTIRGVVTKNASITIALSFFLFHFCLVKKARLPFLLAIKRVYVTACGGPMREKPTISGNCGERVMTERTELSTTLISRCGAKCISGLRFCGRIDNHRSRRMYRQNYTLFSQLE